MAPRGPHPRWGQNFLADANIARAIVDWADVDGRDVIEIGPGRGALTGLLADRARKLVAVEIDAGLADALTERFADNPAVEVVPADALAFDVASLGEGPWRVVSNLPYESGTAILLHLLEECTVIDAMVVMLQREVCERILAEPGARAYGRLAIAVGLRADVDKGRIVKPGAFRPAPKVDSQVLRIRPLQGFRYEVGDVAVFESLVRASFAARRKTLRNTLGAWLTERVGRDPAAALLEACAIDPGARAETVGVEAFAELSRRVTGHA